MSGWLGRGALVGLALLGAVAPVPPELVERWYARGVYPWLQTTVTPLSNLVPIATLDVLLLAGFVLAGVWLWRRALPAVQARSVRGIVRCVGDALLVTAAVYVLFLGSWGYNYRRVPLAAQLDFDVARVSNEGLADLAGRAVVALNALHEETAMGAWSDLRDLPVVLGGAFEAVQRDLGARRPAIAGRPKPTLLTAYFRHSAVDGLTNPLGLEVLINEDLLPYERPFVVAHEWAHLAGYADESEASLVGWLVCQRGDARSRYSAWLFLYPLLARGLDERVRGEIDAALADGPRAHLRAVRARVGGSSPLVRRAAARVYDGYLRANRVEAGIASYDAVVTLLLGTSFAPDWAPRLRPVATFPD